MKIEFLLEDSRKTDKDDGYLLRFRYDTFGAKFSSVTFFIKEDLRKTIEDIKEEVIKLEDHFLSMRE